MDSTAAASDLEKRRAALKAADVVLVSACLLGAACRYDGRDKEMSRLREVLGSREVVPICPEASAGLGIPRPKVELQAGDGAAVWNGAARAVTEHGVERTEEFRLGARIALEAAERFGARVAILKEKSPSCGTRKVYVSGELRDGQGVTAALLRAAGIVVLSEEEI